MIEKKILSIVFAGTAAFFGNELIEKPSLQAQEKPAAAAQEQSEANEDKAGEKVKKVPFTYGPKTTRFTEPLRDDGRVDYIEIMNKRKAEKVKLETNFAVPYMQVFGAKFEGRSMIKECQMLGIPVPDEDAPRYQTLHQYLEGEGVSQEEANELFDRILSKPWTSEEFPQAGVWLKKNEAHLDLLVKASDLPHYYMPRPSADDLMSVLLPDVQTFREAARALICRAHLRLAEGEYEKGLADILAIEKMARKLDDGSFLVERLVGYALRGIHVKGVKTYLETSPAMAIDHTTLLQALKEQPKVELLTQSLEDERFMLLDVVQYLAIHNEMPNAMDQGNPGGIDKFLTAVFSRNIVDWDLAMEEGNKEYDELIEIVKKPTYAERKAAAEQFNEKIKSYSQETKRMAENPLVLAQLFLGGKSAKTKVTKTFIHVLAALLVPATERCMEAHLRTQTQQDCLKIAVAVHAFQAKNDRYPESLDELVPTFLADLPKDAITNQAYLFDKDEAGFAVYTLGPNGKKDLGPAGEITPQNDDWGVAIQVKK